jgi:GNAT superfamily N-acetyltransferase
VDRGEWLALNIRGMAGCFASFARAAGAEVIERDGLMAAVNPAVPERSVFNSVVYTNPEALAETYAELAAAYDAKGCAWTVWVPEKDTATAELLASNGHVLDAKPRAMGAPLSVFSPPDMDGLDWTDEGDVEEAGALNDDAYGYPRGTWTRGMGSGPEGLRTYIARLDGVPASTVAVRHLDGDCPVWNVATVARARGRGLATRLMARALCDAAAAGCETTTLQATALGAPVYRSLGYTDLGALHMWERRGPSAPPRGH